MPDPPLPSKHVAASAWHVLQVHAQGRWSKREAESAGVQQQDLQPPCVHGFMVVVADAVLHQEQPHRHRCRIKMRRRLPCPTTTTTTMMHHHEGTVSMLKPRAFPDS